MIFQRRDVCVALCLMSALVVSNAQQSPPKKLEFEVAVIKPVSPAEMEHLVEEMRAGRTPKVGPQIENSRATYSFMSLDSLIAIAYSARLYQISGPKWMANQRFNIEAVIPAGATKNDVPAMLRTLLEDRFKLTVHSAQVERKVLGLVLAKDDVKMKKASVKPQPIALDAPLKPGEQQSEEPDGPVRTRVDRDGTITRDMGTKGTIVWKPDAQYKTLNIKSNALSMDGYAEMLSYLFLQMSGPDARQVVDMTGLDGYYEIGVDISLTDLMAIVRTAASGAAPAPGAATEQQANNTAAKEAPSSSDPAGLSVLDSVKLAGLKLSSRTARVNQLIVDHLEMKPTEN